MFSTNYTKCSRGVKIRSDIVQQVCKIHVPFMDLCILEKSVSSSSLLYTERLERRAAFCPRLLTLRETVQTYTETNKGRSAGGAVSSVSNGWAPPEEEGGGNCPPLQCRHWCRCSGSPTRSRQQPGWTKQKKSFQWRCRPDSFLDDEMVCFLFSYLAWMFCGMTLHARSSSLS